MHDDYHFTEIDEIIRAYTTLTEDYSLEGIYRGDCPLCDGGDLWVSVEHEVFNCADCGEFGGPEYFYSQMENLTMDDATWALDRRLEMPPEMKGPK